MCHCTQISHAEWCGSQKGMQFYDWGSLFICGWDVCHVTTQTSILILGPMAQFKLTKWAVSYDDVTCRWPLDTLREEKMWWWRMSTNTPEQDTERSCRSNMSFHPSLSQLECILQMKVRAIWVWCPWCLVVGFPGTVGMQWLSSPTHPHILFSALFVIHFTRTDSHCQNLRQSFAGPHSFFVNIFLSAKPKPLRDFHPIQPHLAASTTCAGVTITQKAFCIPASAFFFFSSRKVTCAI